MILEILNVETITALTLYVNHSGSIVLYSAPNSLQNGITATFIGEMFVIVS
jgi:hypothetical protein